MCFCLQFTYDMTNPVVIPHIQTSDIDIIIKPENPDLPVTSWLAVEASGKTDTSSIFILTFNICWFIICFHRKQ